MGMMFMLYETVIDENIEKFMDEMNNKYKIIDYKFSTYFDPGRDNTVYCILICYEEIKQVLVGVE